MSATTRTQDEILARIEAVADEDLFGFRREVLVAQLDFEHAKTFLKPGATPKEWDDDRSAELDVEARARSYLKFAIGKILDHRGISASRSVDKLREWAWLLGRDDVVSAMDSAEYAQYGAPQVKAFAMGMDWADLWTGGPGTETAILDRMADGEPCRPGCDEGCAR